MNYFSLTPIQNINAQVQDQPIKEKNQIELERKINNFKPLKQLLLGKGISFDVESFLSSRGKKILTSQLAQRTEMYSIEQAKYRTKIGRKIFEI